MVRFDPKLQHAAKSSKNNILSWNFAHHHKVSSPTTVPNFIKIWDGRPHCSGPLDMEWLTWYLNQFEFYKRRSAVLKSQSIIEQLRCTDFYKFLNVWLFLNDWLFLNVLMFDQPPTHPPPYDPPPPPLKCSIPHSYLIRARSMAHSKIFLYKSYFKGLYYTLSHTYNAYMFFSIFLLSNMIYFFFLKVTVYCFIGFTNIFCCLQTFFVYMSRIYSSCILWRYTLFRKAFFIIQSLFEY